MSESLTFQYANEADLEIHCSPFGLLGIYIKISNTNLVGIGSTMGLITGSTKGLIHYNDSSDLIDQKFKLYVVVQDDTLRIDFTKIYINLDDPLQAALDDDDTPTLIFRGKCPEGRPNKIDPFIGIFSFEKED